jgi:hypothetical protein
MKKLITFTLLLFTFVSNAQIKTEKTDVKSREDVISAPMLICSASDQNKWFAIVPTFKKFNGIINKTYLVTMKLNIGDCSKQDVLVFTFTDGRKMRIHANNRKNCDGLVELDFELNSIDVAFLETKTLESIRYINGYDNLSFLYMSTPTDKNFFINIFSEFKK